MSLPNWCHARPSTTIVGSFSPGGVSRQNAPDSVKVSHAGRAALQSFPPSFQFQGAKGAVSLMLGNAIPPRLAEAILAELWGEA